MALPYRKWTDEEVQTRGLIAEGQYHFRIIAAEQKLTATGSYEMLVLNLEVNANGKWRRMKDWIVFMDDMDWKLRHLARSTGLMAEYDLGTLDAKHLVGREGDLIIKHQLAKDKINIMNAVEDYVAVAVAANDDFQPDKDISF